MSKFNKLNGNLNVTLNIDKRGCLLGYLKSDAKTNIVAATNIKGRASIFIQTDYIQEEFLEELQLSDSQRKDLDEGWDVTIRMDGTRYVEWVLVQFGSIADRQAYLTPEYIDWAGEVPIPDLQQSTLTNHRSPFGMWS